MITIFILFLNRKEAQKKEFLHFSIYIYLLPIAIKEQNDKNTNKTKL